MSEGKQYEAAWRDHSRRVVFWILGATSFLILMAVSVLSGNTWAGSIAYDLIFFAVSAWFLSALIRLIRFRCPRCGNLFSWKWPPNSEHSRDWRTCCHCGLKQDAEPQTC